MITIRWFPPSWLQIKSSDSILYVDPAYLKKYYSKHASKIEYSTWPDDIDGLPEKLPVADIILLTHEHKDHCKLVTIKRLSNKDTIIYGPGNCKKKVGTLLTIIKPWDEIKSRFFSISAFPSYNTDAGTAEKKTHKKGSCIGYVIKTGDKTIYHPGDSSFISEMKELGKIDIAFIPIDGTFTMNIDEAIQASIAISPKIVVPIHDMGKNDPLQFKYKLEKISNIEVRILKIGDEIKL